MKSKLKHFVDVLFVSICYLGVLAGPLFILLNILNVCSFNTGIMDLACITGAVIVTAVCFVVTKESRIAHNAGRRFLW